MRKRRRGRLVLVVLLGLIVVGVAGGAVLVLTAYSRAAHVADDLDVVRPNLGQVRKSLAHGRLPSGNPLQAAIVANGRAQEAVRSGGLAFRVVSALPWLSRPIQDTKLAAAASDHLVAAATGARDLVTDLLGPEATGAKGNPPVFQNGHVNATLIKAVPGRLSAIIGNLERARSLFAQVKPVPMLSKIATGAKLGVDDTTQAISVGKTTLSAANLLPSFLGIDHPRTYFFALQNNADQRPTGGDILAFALVRAQDGRLTLQNGGSIHLAEPPLGYRGVSLPPAIRWYLDHITTIHLRPRLQNLNLSPDFPTVAEAWDTVMRQGAKIPVDGVIALDPFAIQDILGRSRIRIAADPTPLTSKNLVQEVENRQYLLSHEQQLKLAPELVKAAFPILSKPRSFTKLVKQLGGGFQQKHIQMWMHDPAEEALVQRLGWDAGLHPGSGDFIYTVDNKLRPNKVDYYAYTTLTYDATIDGAGTAHATAHVQIDNRTPADAPRAVVGRWALREGQFALNRLLLGLYVPQRATWTGHAKLEYPQHVEGPARVFGTNVDSVPGKPGIAVFQYVVPNAVQSTSSGHVYRLSIQHQPLANLQQVHVRITLPAGTHIRSAPGWKVSGNVARYDGLLRTDVVLEIEY